MLAIDSIIEHQTVSDAWPDYHAFSDDHGPNIPPSLLPGAFGEFAGNLSSSTETPPALATMVTLGCLSAACNGKFRVEINAGWAEPVNLYTAVILPPGTGKSPVFTRCRAPLEAWEKVQKQIREPEIKRQIAEKLNQEALIQRYRTQGSRTKDPIEQRSLFDKASELSANLIRVDPIPRIFTTDATPETLTQHVAERAGRFAVLSDEAGIVEVMAGLYSNGKANIDIYLKGWDGGSLRVDRSGFSLECNPLLAVVLAFQPKILTNIGKREALQGNGFSERILWVIPEDNLGFRSNRTRPLLKSVEGAYAASLTDILDCQNNEKVLRLSPEAHAKHLDFLDSLEKKIRKGGELREIAGFASKLRGYSARIAGLLHIAEHGPSCSEIIDAATMIKAINLCTILHQHALVAYQAIGLDPATLAAQKLLEYLPRFSHRPFSLTQLRETVKNAPCLIGKHLRVAIEELIERFYLREIQTEKISGGGRKTQFFQLNPKVFASEHQEVQKLRQ